MSSTVSHLIKLGSVTEENRDIYEYGLQILSSTFVNFAITVTLGIIFGVPLETFLMFMSFTAIRAVSGGYHAKSFFGCVGASAISMLATILSVKLFPDALLLPTTIVLSVVSIGLIFAFAPVEHPNRPLEAGEVVKFRKWSRLIVVITVLTSVLFFSLQITRCGFGILLGIALSVASTSVAAITTRKEV